MARLVAILLLFAVDYHAKAAVSDSQPNFVFILPDGRFHAMTDQHRVETVYTCCHVVAFIADVGWADVDWNRPKNYPEKSTPHMAKLVENGIRLDRHCELPNPSIRISIDVSIHPFHSYMHA